MKKPALLLSLFLSLACNSEDVGVGVDPALESYEDYVVFYGGENEDLRGQPMYAGQALVLEGCATAGRCHFSGANGTERNGVPAGLDFDLIPCNERRDGGCAEEVIAALRARQQHVFDWREHIYGTLRSGVMPPEGAQQLQESAYVREFDDSLPVRQPVDTTRLPAIGSAEAHEIIRRWLASGAPMIATWDPSTSDPTADCDFNEGFWPECVRGLDITPPPIPSTWEAIHGAQFGSAGDSGCSTSECHESGNEIGLDLQSLDDAYEAICGNSGTCETVTSTSNDECNGFAIPYVTPGEPQNSLLYLKLLSESQLAELGVTICGDQMLAGTNPVSERLLVAVRGWIEAGAAR